MNFQNYMQLELKPELNENIIRFKNVVKLDGEYEVALIDIMYEHYSQSIENRKYDVTIIKDENFDIRFNIHIPEEGVVNKHSRPQLLAMANTVDRVQLSEFDIWNYQIKTRYAIGIEINIVTNELFKNHPNAEYTLYDLLGYLNAGIKDKEEEIKRAVKQSFRETNGKSSITKNRYFELPKFDVNFDKSMVHLFIPYYVSGVKLSNWLAKITSIDVNTEKDLITLPEAPLTNKSLEYKMFDPMRCVTGIVKETETDGINILVYCSLIDYQIVGSISSPLLRILALNRNRKGINWRQYTKPQYIPLKYSQFQELTIRVLDEKGKPPHFLNKIFLVLHFRKKT